MYCSGLLVDEGLPEQLFDVVEQEMPFPSEQRDVFSDVCFTIDDYYFRCHKAFVCGRSSYFRALCDDHFGEARYYDNPNQSSASSSSSSSISDHHQLQHHLLPVIPLHYFSPQVFTAILYYIYEDTLQVDPDELIETIVAGDLCLLPGLTRKCGLELFNLVTTSNVISIIETGRTFNISKLESLCAQFIAQNLHMMIENEELKGLILRDAADVKERQETDSISIIDDIRYYISCNLQSVSDVASAQQKLQLVDSLLESLNLDA